MDREPVAFLPQSSDERKNLPMCTGVLDYFPAAIAAIARLSRKGNDKHNPGEPLHWARGKSMDHADCIVRHVAERGTIDPDDGEYHETKLAWRALALLQEAEEKRGAPMARGARPAPFVTESIKGVERINVVEASIFDAGVSDAGLEMRRRQTANLRGALDDIVCGVYGCVLCAKFDR